MKYSARIKPISYVITQNGEARAVLQDVVSYEQTQETLALLKVLALGTAASGKIMCWRRRGIYSARRDSPNSCDAER